MSGVREPKVVCEEHGNRQTCSSHQRKFSMKRAPHQLCLSCAPRNVLFHSVRQRRVTELFVVEVHQVELCAMLGLALTQIMQIGLPLPILRQILRSSVREQNMAGVPAAH